MSELMRQHEEHKAALWRINRNARPEPKVIHIQSDADTRQLEAKIETLANSVGILSDRLDKFSSRLKSIEARVAMFAAIDVRIQTLSAAVKQIGVAVLGQNTSDDRTGQGVAIRDVICACAKHFGVSVTRIRGPSRDTSAVEARFAAMYICKEMTGQSSVVIGREFGDRDHTSVLNAVKRFNGRLAESAELTEGVKSIIESLKSVASASPNQEMTDAAEQTGSGIPAQD